MNKEEKKIIEIRNKGDQDFITKEAREIIKRKKERNNGRKTRGNSNQ